MRLKECEFLKCDASNAIKRHILHQNFKISQQTFVRTQRQAEPNYRRKVADNIKSMSTKNPNEFWGGEQFIAGA